MNFTLVIAGGYWGLSKKLHKQVDPDNDAMDRGVDYVLRIKGLPDHFLPTEKKVKQSYFCTQCQKLVPEWEVENKVGCYQLHKCEQHLSTEDEWPMYVYGPVNEQIKKKKSALADGIVLWVNNPQGLMKLEQIFNYIEKSLPAGQVMPTPVAVGTHSGWVIESKDDIPLVELPNATPEAEKKSESQKCPHCDATVALGELPLKIHISQKHPEIYRQKYSEGAQHASNAHGGNRGS